MGFFAISGLPIAMESAIEVTYPTPEATPTGVLILSGNLFGILILIGMNVLQVLIEHFV